MNTKSGIRNFFIAIALSFTAPLIAIGQQTQPPFKYNVEYKCGNERVVVRYCRNDRGQPVPSSSNYCHVEYLDRPTNVPSIPFFTSELQSEIAVKLRSCKDPVTGAPASNGETGTAAGASSLDNSIAKARAAKVDLSILGMQFGEPLRLPLCPLLQLSPMTQNCRSQEAELAGEIAAQYGTESTVPADMKIINLTNASCPSWVKDCIAYVTVHDGKLDGVALYTNGRNAVSTVTNDLIAKYGKPTSIKPRTFKPDVGNAFSYNEPSWTLPGLRVGYEVLFSENDDDRATSKVGIVRIMTESEYQRRIAKHKETVKPKL